MPSAPRSGEWCEKRSGGKEVSVQTSNSRLMPQEGFGEGQLKKCDASPIPTHSARSDRAEEMVSGERMTGQLAARAKHLQCPVLTHAQLAFSIVIWPFVLMLYMMGCFSKYPSSVELPESCGPGSKDPQHPCSRWWKAEHQEAIVCSPEAQVRLFPRASSL